LIDRFCLVDFCQMHLMAKFCPCACAAQCMRQGHVLHAQGICAAQSKSLQAGAPFISNSHHVLLSTTAHPRCVGGLIRQRSHASTQCPEALKSVISSTYSVLLYALHRFALEPFSAGARRPPGHSDRSWIQQEPAAQIAPHVSIIYIS